MFCLCFLYLFILYLFLTTFVRPIISTSIGPNSTKFAGLAVYERSGLVSFWSFEGRCHGYQFCGLITELRSSDTHTIEFWFPSTRWRNIRQMIFCVFAVQGPLCTSKSNAWRWMDAGSWGEGGLATRSGVRHCLASSLQNMFLFHFSIAIFPRPLVSRWIFPCVNNYYRAHGPYLHPCCLSVRVSAVGPTRRKNESIGIMFLCEVALGREHNIQVGNGSLACAPKGYDSIVARGQTEPGNT